MTSTEKKIRTRKKWIEYYLENHKSITLVCRRLGISRATFYRWYKRYAHLGLEGLKDISQRPKSLGNQKTTLSVEQLILELRKKKKSGPQRISSHLTREYDIHLSKTTVWRILKKYGIKLLTRYRRKRDFHRYTKPLPGDRVQIDVMKVAAGRYQFTAIDDCTRLRVIRIYPRKSAENAVVFLGELLDDFGFPIRVIQTDWGTEFFNDAFQQELMEHYIRFRPIRPRSPHLNGKVERSLLSDKAEFYTTIDTNSADLAQKVFLWQQFYNRQRIHSSLGGKTPYERFLELEDKLPTQPEVSLAYMQYREKILPRNALYLYSDREKLDEK